MLRLVVWSLAVTSLVVSHVSPVRAGLWEKFWAEKHMHHNAKRGVHHNHYHHHKVHGCRHGKHEHEKNHAPCKCKQHAAVPSCHAPVSVAPVYPHYPQQVAVPPPVYQAPVQPQPVTVQPVPVPTNYLPPPAPILQPPVTTPTVSWQNTSRLEYRLQPQTQTIPITRHRTVTVDEGSWQKIWVPKVVAKQVPETVYQQQTIYRPVLHQVNQFAPRARLVSTHVSMPPPCYPSPDWLGYGYPPPTPVVGTPRYSVQPSTLSPVIPGPRGPVILGREIEPLENLAPTPTLGPVPEPRSDAGYSDPVPVEAARPEPLPTRSASAAGMFVPAPSAASLWRARMR